MLRALVGASLVAVLVVSAPRWHFGGALAAWCTLFVLDPQGRRNVGRLRSWIAPALVLGLVGAWLGPPDARLFGARFSSAGALAAGTMIARSLAIVLVSSSLVDFARRLGLAERLRGPAAKRFAEVVGVAVALVPSIQASLRDERDARGRPRRPRELFDLWVAVLVEASDTAHRVASAWSEPATPEAPTDDPSSSP
jgi:hypothetical protein